MRIIDSAGGILKQLPIVNGNGKPREFEIISDEEPEIQSASFFQRIAMPFTPRKKRRVSHKQEVSVANLEFVSSWISDQYTYDPELLYQKYKLRVFRRMLLQNSDAKAAILLKQLSVLSDDWEIYSSGDTGSALKQSEFVRHQIKNIPFGIESVIEKVLEGIVFGFSLSEKVYDVIPKGEWKGLLGYKVIRDKPVFNFSIDTSSTGEIQSFTQDQEDKGPVTIPAWKMVYWGYQSTSENPYGYSDLCPAFQHIFAQSVMDESWPTALKRYAMPVLMAKMRGGARTKKEEDYLEVILKKIREESGIVIKDNVEEISYLEQGTSNMAYTAYQKHQEYRSQKIRLSCLVPDLAISEGTRIGSKALGESQIKSFAAQVIQQLRRKMSVVVNEQIIKPLVDLNFKDVTDYPVFSFGPSQREDDEKWANIITSFIASGVIDIGVETDREWIREKFGMPPEGKKRRKVPTPTGIPMPSNNKGNKNGTTDDKNNTVTGIGDAEVLKRYNETTISDGVMPTYTGDNTNPLPYPLNEEVKTKNIATSNEAIIPYFPDLSGVWAIDKRVGRIMYWQYTKYIESGFNLGSIYADTTGVQSFHSERGREYLKERYTSWYDGTTAVVNISGVLMKHDPPSMSMDQSAITYPKLTLLLTDLVADRDTDKIILKISSGGGNSQGVIQCADAIAKLNKVKPIIAFCDDLCCSAAYLLACQCSDVISAEGATLGSIGAYTVLTDLSAQNEALGIKRYVISTSDIKGAGADDKVSKELRQEVQTMVDDFQVMFRTRVKSGRDMTEAEVDKVSTGAIFYPEKALDLKLIDNIENFDDVVNIGSQSNKGVKPSKPSEITIPVEGDKQVGQTKEELQADIDALEAKKASIAEEVKTAEDSQVKDEQYAEMQAKIDEAELKADAYKVEKEDLEKRQKEYEEAEVQRVNEYRSRFCSNWVSKRLENKVITPASAPMLNAFLKTLTDNRTAFNVAYKENDGSDESLDGQHYEIALDVLDAVFSTKIDFTEKSESIIAKEFDGAEAADVDAENEYMEFLKEQGVELDTGQVLVSKSDTSKVDEYTAGGMIHQDV